MNPNIATPSPPSAATEISYRAGTEDDSPRLALLLQNHYNWINVNHSPFSVVHRNISLEAMRNGLQGLPSVVAEIDDLVIGFALTRPQEPSIMELRNLYVDDPYRGHGIGQTMLSSIEPFIAHLGYSMILATASSHWYPRKPLPTKVFERAGYEITKLDNETELYLRQIPDELRVVDIDATAIRRITYRDAFKTQF